MAKLEYCKFCGGIDLSNIKIGVKKTKSKEFKPEISYEQIKANAGHIGRKKESKTAYISKFCKTCRNLDTTTHTEIYYPLEAVFSDSKQTVIIPYLLKSHLFSVEYDESEITKLLRSVSKHLSTIYNKWSIQGKNPCRCERVGTKLAIKLKHGIEVICYVIVEVLRGKPVLRMSYGGYKIECPEN